MILNAISQDVGETVRSERYERFRKQQRTSDFVRQLNGTLNTMRPTAPASPLVDIDWSHNVMITATIASGAQSHALANTSARAALHTRLCSAIRAAAVSGVGHAALALPAETTAPVFVSEVETVSKRADYLAADSQAGTTTTSTVKTLYTFRLQNEKGLTVEEHDWWRHIPKALKDAGLLTARTYF